MESFFSYGAFGAVIALFLFTQPRFVAREPRRAMREVPFGHGLFRRLPGPLWRWWLYRTLDTLEPGYRPRRPGTEGRGPS